MAPIVASMVQAMAGIFHPFVSLCFHCIFVPGHIASRLNAIFVCYHDNIMGVYCLVIHVMHQSLHQATPPALMLL